MWLDLALCDHFNTTTFYRTVNLSVKYHFDQAQIFLNKKNKNKSRALRALGRSLESS